MQCLPVNISKVGLMLNGTTVDGVVFGGPAYNSQKIVRGDVIREVINAIEISINLSPRDLKHGKEVMMLHNV
jgi:hypothetical protein